MMMAGGPSEWKDSLLDNIIVNLKTFNPSDSGSWGATTESYNSVSYESVRERKARRRGVTFISSKQKENFHGERRSSQSRVEEKVQ
jgi:hypothetical protein